MPGSDKHFLNTPSALVLDSLHGLCIANPLVKLDVANRGISVIMFLRTAYELSLSCIPVEGRSVEGSVDLWWRFGP